MVSREIRIINKLGLHARAAAKFVSTASRFAADIKVEKDDQSANGKSIMGIMMLAAFQGSSLLVSAVGEDAEEALNALDALVQDRFGEGE
ncbi:MAG: HPr family phosphocarrier protein [Pseudomonadota bacterium]